MHLKRILANSQESLEDEEIKNYCNYRVKKNVGVKMGKEHGLVNNKA